MGIPKFYRWTSERYPCLSEIIKEYQIPEFDNLYLDMNGIIHNCSHPNDEDVHLRISEKQIFKDIFHYIEFLFKMIKPCKVFFMAIDGVAPRAKMNQQRGRRFRSARIAEEQEAEAINKGEVLPSEERFDSNCITPGTEFMARLHEQLKYFIQVKISTDPLWQKEGLTVYLSGHDVPGEGEHKIMDFIRHIRSKKDFDTTTRHCLYGLDADLVMLGLSTHELNFSLLREEVKFSRPRKNKKGLKHPPKQNAGTASYDLTNVSIFKYEGSSVNGLNSVMRPPQGPNPEASVVRDGTSFAEVLEMTAEPKTVTVAASIPKKAHGTDNGTCSEEQAPPPPSEATATGSYKAPLPEKTTFLLLHLSLMRDYIDFEFQELKERLENQGTLKYDLEKIIDDWILMNILVGNDFVPHLPHLHIVKGALPMLYRTYMEVLPTLDGYLNENGILNLRRFESFIKKLSQFDIEIFRETYDDMKYMESKTGKNIVLGEKMFVEKAELEGFDFEGEEIEEEELEPLSPELKALAQRTEDEVFGEKKGGAGKLCTDVFPDDDDYFQEDDSQEMKLEFLQYKRNYYISKLHVDEISTQFLEMYCKEYIRAIQWVLLYYYKGVSSWGWFYPFHYAPFASDLKKFTNYTIEFDKGQPFRPFEQLLAVLPSQSKKLLPACYQWLMTDKESPIFEFYPEKFEQDLNGKKQDWEAVVLIPFIDEGKLLKVMEIEELKLSKEEAHRNARGLMTSFTYTKDETGPVNAPRDLFPALPSSHVRTEGISEVTYDPALLPKGIHPQAKRNTIYQGFPTLKSKPVKCVIEKAEIKVFEFVTREESMVLSLEDVSDEYSDVESLARKLLGKSVWVNWPHLTYAYVTGVLTREGKFIEEAGRIIKDPRFVESRSEKEFDVVAKGLKSRHLKCKGMKLGQMSVILYAKMMEGRKVRCDVKGNVDFETQWSKFEQPFALKTCVYEENVTEIFYLDRTLAKSYLELYRIGDQVFYLGDKLFGTIGTVIGHDEAKSNVIVSFEVPARGVDEHNLKNLIGHQELKSHDYYNSYTAAGKCQISSYILSRITGTVFINVEKERKASKRLGRGNRSKKLLPLNALADPSPSDSSSDEDFPALEMKKVNVGLDLKFNKKNLEVRGYTSKRDGQWYYSGKAIQLVNDFVMRFSDFIQALTRCEKGADVYNASDLFPVNAMERVNEMAEWVEQRGVRDLTRIPTNTKLLDDDDIDAVWKYILKNKSAVQKPTIKKWSVRPNLLLKPGLDRGCVAPVPNSRFDMLDRVICVDRGAPIAVGHRGTVVGIQTPAATEPEQIEESFKSTGAATIRTLIVLVDPTPGVFDKPDEFGMADPVEKLTNALASMLGVQNGLSEIATTSDQASLTSAPEPRPRLIKLYPYQAINLSQGPSIIRETHKITKQVNRMNVGNGFLPVSRENEVLLSKNIQRKPFPDNSKPIRILTRPANTPSVNVNNIEKSTVMLYNSQLVHENKRLSAGTSSKGPVAQNLQQNQNRNPDHKQKTNQQSSQQPTVKKNLPWPPEPRKLTPLEELFSAAAFAQQQQQIVPPGNPFPFPTTSSNGVINQKVSQSVQQNAAHQAVPEKTVGAFQRCSGSVNQVVPETGGKSQIFSAATAFHQVSPNRSPKKGKKQHPPAGQEAQGLMLLLNNAHQQYESRDKKRKPQDTRSYNEARSQQPHQNQQQHPRPQPQQSHQQQHFNNHQRNDFRQDAPTNQSLAQTIRGPNPFHVLPSGPPPPPPTWCMPTLPPQHVPVPIHHTGPAYYNNYRNHQTYNPHPRPNMRRYLDQNSSQTTSFVPTQVARKQAQGPTPRQQYTGSQRQGENQNDLTGGGSKGVAGNQGFSNSTQQQLLKESKTNNELSSAEERPRKSKIAANFGGAFS